MRQAAPDLNLATKRTRKLEFLAQTERAAPWAALVELMAPCAPEVVRGRRLFPVETKRRIHFIRQWFTSNGLAMEVALQDIALSREFPALSWDSRLPDHRTILRSGHQLEEHELAEQMLGVVTLREKGLMLKAGTVVDAKLISAPSSTKSAGGERVPETHQAKNGNQWYFGTMAHIVVDSESGLVNAVRGTAARVKDVVEDHGLLRRQERDVFVDAGYEGAHKLANAKHGVRAGTWSCAQGKRRALDKTMPADRLIDEVERQTASMRAKVEHPFSVIKRQFGHVKVRYLRPEGEHRAAAYAVRAVEPTDDSRKTAGTGWATPSESE